MAMNRSTNVTVAGDRGGCPCRNNTGGLEDVMPYKFKVGESVLVTRVTEGWSTTQYARWVGKRGIIRSIDTEDATYPYSCSFRGTKNRWAFAARELARAE